MPKIGDFYENKAGAKYVVLYLSGQSTAVPSTDHTVYLQRVTRAFYDIDSQKYVSLPIHLLNAHFTITDAPLDHRPK